MSLMKDMKDVIDVIKQPSIITKIKPIKEPIIIQIGDQNTIDTKVLTDETNLSSLSIKNKDIEKINNNEPYKYYSKKDIKKHNLNIYWGSEEELYDSKTYKNEVIVSLKLKPLFNNIYNKDKKTLEEKIKILQSVYNLKKINKIEGINIDLIYKLFVYDDITIIIENNKLHNYIIT